MIAEYRTRIRTLLISMSEFDAIEDDIGREADKTIEQIFKRFPACLISFVGNSYEPDTDSQDYFCKSYFDLGVVAKNLSKQNAGIAEAERISEAIIKKFEDERDVKFESIEPVMVAPITIYVVRFYFRSRGYI